MQIIKINKSSTKKKLFFDASIMSKSSCLYRVKLIVADGLRAAGQTRFKLDFGSGFHVFLSNYYKDQDVAKALKLATDYYKDKSSEYSEPPEVPYRVNDLIQGCIEYTEVYPFQRECDLQGLQVFKHGSNSFVEKKFAFPIYENDSHIAYFSGTVDMIGINCGTPCIVEHKTTGSWKMNEFLDQYRLSLQCIVYSIIVDTISKYYGYLNFIGIPILINGIFISKTGFNFKRSDLFGISDSIKQEVSQELLRKIKYITDNATSYSLRDGISKDVCKAFNDRCMFSDACLIDDLQERSSMLNAMFERKPYNPLKRD